MKRIVQKPIARQPWFYSIVLLCATLLFPDFICFPLCVAAFILACIDVKTRGAYISFGRCGVVLMVLLGYAAVSTVYSTNPTNSFATFWMWVCMFLGFLTVTSVVYTRERLFTALQCVVVTLGTVGGVAVLQYVLRETFGLSISSKLWESFEFIVYSFFGFPMDNTDFGERVSGTFYNPNMMAISLAILLPFCLAYLLSHAQKKHKAPMRLSVLLAIYALGFSFCRGAYLAMIAVGFLLALLFIRKRFVITVLVTLYVLLLVPNSIGNRLLSALPGSIEDNSETVTDMTENAQEEELEEIVKPPQTVTQQMSDRYQHDKSIRSRFFIWEKVGINSLRSPLFGAGFGIGSTQVTLRAANVNYSHAHNLFLELFAEGGIVLLGMFCILLCIIAYHALSLLWRCKEPRARLLGFAMLAAGISICILGMFDFPLSTPRNILTFMLFVGFSDTAARIYLRKPTFALFAAKTVPAQKAKTLSKGGIRPS